MNKTKSNKKMYLAALLAAPFITFAQNGVSAPTTSYFSNALFDALFVAIIILLILIVAMSSVLKNLTQSEYFQEKYKTNNNGSNITKTITVFLLLGLLSNNLLAQNSAIHTNDSLISGLDSFTFYFMIVIIIVELITILILFNLIKGFINIGQPKVTRNKSTVKEKTIIEKLNNSVDIEKEADIMLDHDYDGIRELDNNLPPWWIYGFYLTIVISVVYMIHYHVTGSGDLQDKEYDTEVRVAKLKIDEYMKNSASNVDETTVKMLEGTDIAEGKDIYMANCVACHGKLGEGSVGPNLTDVNWIHGGGLADIFKSIKYGWTDKGMKSWKEDLSPMQMAQVTSFIKTLQGTNPPNGKAAQGDAYSDTEAVLKTDTLNAVIDTANVTK